MAFASSNPAFEGTYRGNLHFHFVAEPNDAPGAPADEMVARRLEDVEIIFHRRKRHEPAHAQVGHIDEETQVAHVGHERRITLRLAGLQLRFKEGEQLHVFAVALGVGGIAFGVGNVIGGLLERMRRSRGCSRNSARCTTRSA